MILFKKEKKKKKNRTQIVSHKRPNHKIVSTIQRKYIILLENWLHSLHHLLNSITRIK